MRKLILGAATASVLLTSGCAGMSPREQRTLSGGAIGAAGGAAIGAMTGGSPMIGALIGGAGGAAIGAISGPDHRHRRY